VKSRTTERFRKCFKRLPAQIQQRARKAYKLFQEHPDHPGLRFKRVHLTEPIVSVRVGLGYRALGIQHDDEIVWFWIGSHSDYDNLVS
jgi:hypothetical protein